jgi:hypothetical protein
MLFTHKHMKKINIAFYIAAFSLSFLTACKNDLEVLAPGKESVSVYGVINPNEAVQNIRINKVFLTEGDALLAGQDPNTVNYGPGELMVTLQRFSSETSETPILTTVGDATKKEIVLTETVVTTKSGSFSDQQRIWQTTDKLYNNGYYKLTIKNVATGSEFTSKTAVIDSVKTTGNPQPMPILYIPTNPNAYPMHGNYPAQPTSLDRPKYVNYDVLSVEQQIRFRSVPNGKLYSVVMRFHYIDSLIGGGTQNGYVDYNFSTIKSKGLNGGEYFEKGAGEYIGFLTNDFYTNLGTEMAKKSTSNVRNRRSNYMEYIVTAGSENLADFLQVNAPSTSIAQDKPFYTNISGGIGVFGSMSKTITTKDLWNDFIDKIACHPSTFPYLFCRSNGIPSPTSCN